MPRPALRPLGRPLALVALALLAPGTSLAADLELSPPLPGRAGRDNTFLVTGLGPSDPVMVVGTRHAGPMPPVKACPGPQKVTRHTDDLVLGPVEADPLGEVVVVGHIPWHAEGQTWRFQAVDLVGCAWSDEGSVDFPAGLVATLDLADLTLLGEEAYAYAGAAVTGLGDVDGDAESDLLVGAWGAGAGGTSRGAAYLVHGPFTAGMDLAGADRLAGEHDHAYAGSSVAAAGDVDGNGLADALIGAHATGPAGTAYLVGGPWRGDAPLDQAGHRLLGESPGDHAGIAVAGAGDTNGDGFGDLLVGAYRRDWGAGAAYLVLGPVGGDVALGSAEARIRGVNRWDYAGVAVSGGADPNGDGFADLLVGATGADDAGTDAGAVYLLDGPVSGDVSLADADAVLLGRAAGELAGGALAGAGDVDGDGTDDLVIAAERGRFGRRLPTGGAAVVFGPVDGDRDLADADAEIVGAYHGEWAGQSLDVAGDFDGDGFDDLIVGARSTNLGTDGAGTALVVYGPLRGWVELAAAEVTLVGTAPHELAGTAVAGVGDVDRDGFDDVLIGAVGNSEAGMYAGAAYLIGGGL